MTAAVLDPGYRSRRKWRYDALNWLRSTSVRGGARRCMMANVELGSVTIAATAAAAHVGGVTRCASPWACPVCTPVIAERRAVEIDAALLEAARQGLVPVFVTATVRHRRADELQAVRSALQAAYSATFRFKKRPAWYAGQIRAVEVTYGGNGWHPHVHSVVFVDPSKVNGPLDPPGLVEQLEGEYVRQLHRAGLSGVHGVAWKVEPVFDRSGLSAYLSKSVTLGDGWGVGSELSRSHRKVSRTGGITPFELLASAVAEYEAATKGARQLVWSPGLKARLAVEVLEDGGAAVGAPPEDPDVIVSVPRDAWDDLVVTGAVSFLLDDVQQLAVDPAGEWRWPPGWLRSVRPVSLAAAG
jgi:Replication protein